MSTRLCALAFGCAVACGSTFAYGPNGHMAVGSIADATIAGTPTAKEVRKILGSNLRTSSVWADCAKGVSPTTFKYGGEGQVRRMRHLRKPGQRAADGSLRTPQRGQLYVAI